MHSESSTGTSVDEAECARTRMCANIFNLGFVCCGIYDNVVIKDSANSVPDTVLAVVCGSDLTTTT
jgi:hypothetical protein